MAIRLLQGSPPVGIAPVFACLQIWGVVIASHRRAAPTLGRSSKTSSSSLGSFAMDNNLSLATSTTNQISFPWRVGGGGAIRQTFNDKAKGPNFIDYPKGCVRSRSLAAIRTLSLLGRASASLGAVRLQYLWKRQFSA